MRCLKLFLKKLYLLNINLHNRFSLFYRNYFIFICCHTSWYQSITFFIIWNFDICKKFLWRIRHFSINLLWIRYSSSWWMCTLLSILTLFRAIFLNFWNLHWFFLWWNHQLILKTLMMLLMLLMEAILRSCINIIRL